MTKARLDGLQLVLLGSALFVLAGFVASRVTFTGLIYFRQLYCASRSLIEHHDPYNPDQLRSAYQAHFHDLPPDPAKVEWLSSALSHCPNLPTTFLVLAPFALLPGNLADALWMLVTAGSIVLASYLIWNVEAERAPRLSALFIFLLLVNSEMLLSLGNTAGSVVGLCVIAVWCFLRDRFALAGILCLALSLVMKPQDGGFVWLYFLLAGGLARKRALQTLAVAALIALPAVLWISHFVPHWLAELHAILAAMYSRGGLDDPGPQSGGALGVNMIVSLQTIFSRIYDESAFYNPAAYLICAIPIVIWVRKSLRSRYSTIGAWYALAAIVPFTLLVVYHRCYDCRLLMLTVPACIDLWLTRSPVRWWALALTVAGITVTGDLLWIAVFHFTGYSHSSLEAAMIPAPVALAALGVFYMWTYIKHGDASAPSAAAAKTAV